MSTKLTLTLDITIIKKANQYAKRSNQSLSGLVESYLEKLTATEEPPEEVPKAFKELFGAVNLPSDMDDKQSIREILSEKHQS